MKKYLLIYLFSISLIAYGCTSVNSQELNPDVKADNDLKVLLSNLSKTKEDNVQTQQVAEKKQTQIVNNAAETITSLKAEVTTLKTKLDEANHKNDSVNSANSEPEFNLKGTGR